MSDRSPKSWPLEDRYAARVEQCDRSRQGRRRGLKHSVCCQWTQSRGNLGYFASRAPSSHRALHHEYNQNMSLTRVLVLIGSLSLLTISGCAGGSGFYTGGAVSGGSGAYGYPGWPHDVGPPYRYGPSFYGGWAAPGPFVGPPPIYPRAFYPRYGYAPRVGYGHRWSGHRHFRR